MLGMDFLTDNGAIIGLQAKSISFSAERAVMPKPSAKQRTSLGIANDHVTLLPRASVMITVDSQDVAPEADAIVESDRPEA